MYVDEPICVSHNPDTHEARIDIDARLNLTPLEALAIAEKLRLIALIAYALSPPLLAAASHAPSA